MSAYLALMLEISRKKEYTDGLKIFRSQELLPVSLETRVQYRGGEITSSRYLFFIVMFKSPFLKIVN
jgi:hypothetical protein